MSEQYRIGHLSVDSPWGNAGGVVKTPEEVELMAHTGVGWIEAGSYTLEPRAGNSPNGERVYWHDPVTGETANSLGMPNKGFDIVEGQIPEMVEVANGFGKSLVINVAPVSEDPVTETQELVDRAYSAGADAVLLNAGCPNVITADGSRHEILSLDPAAFKLVLNGLVSIVEKYDKKAFVRTSPQSGTRDVGQIMQIVRQSGVISAVFTPNTWPGFKPEENGHYVLEVSDNVGGKSGPAMAYQALRQARWARRALYSSGIDVVISSGITSGNALQVGLSKNVGAVAGAGTTLYYESANQDLSWAEATDRLLRQFAEIG